MTNLPVALTIAGSDSGGGAGIQADLKTFEALGVFGASAITAVTAQNTTGVRAIQNLDPGMVRDQIQAVLEDLRPRAVKTGMLSTAPIIHAVADALHGTDLPLVVDPVMVAKSGARLLEDDAKAALVERILPMARLVTPNAPEAEALLGRPIRDLDAMHAALDDLLAMGPRAVLLKGGHIEGPVVTDLLHDGTQVHVLQRPRHDTPHTHGTGCALAAGIAAGLAHGHPLVRAVEDADALLQHAIRYGLALGGGHGPVHHLARLRNEASRARVLHEVHAALERFCDPAMADAVPEIGTNIAALTTYPVGRGDVAGVEGRIHRVRRGDAYHVQATGSVRFGASRHVADLLLAIHAEDATVGAAINLRYDDATQAALDRLGWDVAAFDRADEPADVKRREGGTLPWGARRAMRGRVRAPDAVVDPGDVGKEPIVRLLGTDAAHVVDKAFSLAQARRAVTQEPRD